MSTVLEPPVETIDKHLEEVETVTIRFAGDSGDGMQLTGTQFTNTSAVVGNDISTLPDFPGRDSRSCRQLAGRQRFSVELFQPGHQDARRSAERAGGDESGGVESEPADLEEGGTLIVNTDEFTAENLEVCELRIESARGRLARRLSRAQAADLDAQHECVERQRRAFAQRDRSLQKLLRARRALLALRSADGKHARTGFTPSLERIRNWRRRTRSR